MKTIFFILYLMTVPAANWLIQHVGNQFEPQGPHLISVGFGLMAPSGVLMIGAALVLRDIVQLIQGRTVAVVAIFLGCFLSWFVAPRMLALASCAAFLLSEFFDMAVYTPLSKNKLIFAVIASCFVGSVIDSAVFLWLAFGSFDFITGQIVGKFWMALLAIPFIAIARFKFNKR